MRSKQFCGKLLTNMNTESLLQQHPSICHHDEMAAITRPLQTLGISYFAHARLNEQGELAANGSNPDFFADYYREGFYNYDLHFDHKHQPEKFFLWDLVERRGKTEELYQRGLNYDVGHIITLIREHAGTTDFYHFAAPLGDSHMNEFYVTHIDILEQYIEYFNNQLLMNERLNRAYLLTTTPSDTNTGFQTRDNKPSTISQQSLDTFLSDIGKKTNTNNVTSIGRRETQCAQLLLDGKTSKEIAQILDISHRTVEVYIQRLRSRFNSRNKVHLARHLCESGQFGVD